MDRGFVKLYRSTLDSRVFASEKALKIWIWCLAKASHKKEYVPISTGKGDTIVEIYPGQFIFGKRQASKELRMKPTTVYDWMKRFSSPSFNMITLKPDRHYTVVTICNWEYYQAQKDTSRPRTDHEPTTNRPRTDTYKNVKNVKNIKKDILSPNPKKSKKSFLSPQEFLEIYHEKCPNLSRVKILSEKRKEKIKTRLEEMGNPETVVSTLTKLGESNFCNGENSRSWKANFDWIIENDTNWVKVYEDRYKTASNGKAKNKHGAVSFTPGGVQGSSTL